MESSAKTKMTKVVGQRKLKPSLSNDEAAEMSLKALGKASKWPLSLLSFNVTNKIKC